MTRRIPELDGLRGIAILLVLSWHYLDTLLADTPAGVRHVADSLNRYGWTGVDLFFVLSGFLIGGILLDNRRSPAYFRTFYARRFFRIVPAYAAVMVCYVLLQYGARPAIFAWLFDRPMPLWSYLTFTQNFAMGRADTFGAQWLGATWSLAVEEQFYLLLPLVVRFVPRRALVPVLAVFAVGAPITRAVLVFTNGARLMPTYVWMPARADALMLGVLAAVALRHDAARAWIAARRTAGYAVFGVLGAAIAAMALLHETIASGPMVIYGYTIVAVFYAVTLVLAVTAPDGDMLGRALRWRWLGTIGTVAYSIYLVHLPMLGVSSLIVAGGMRVALLGMVLTLALATMSWRYFERPLVRVGHRYAYE